MTLPTLVCPNCYGKSCSECIAFGPFGLVPDGEDVAIVLRTNKSAMIPVSVAKADAFMRWMADTNASMDDLDKAIRNAVLTSVRTNIEEDPDDE